MDLTPVCAAMDAAWRRKDRSTHAALFAAVTLLQPVAGHPRAVAVLSAAADLRVWRLRQWVNNRAREIYEAQATCGVTLDGRAVPLPYAAALRDAEREVMDERVAALGCASWVRALGPASHATHPADQTMVDTLSRLSLTPLVSAPWLHPRSPVVLATDGTVRPCSHEG